LESAIVANRFLRLPAVETRTGYSGTTIWRKVKAGDFPKPVSIGPNATGWVEAEVDDWIQRKIDASRKSSLATA
jgi:prophage regulatory protein